MLGLVLVSISVSIPCIIVLVYVLQSVAMLACLGRRVDCHAVDVLHTSSHGAGPYSQTMYSNCKWSRWATYGMVKACS